MAIEDASDCDILTRENAKACFKPKQPLQKQYHQLYYLAVPPHSRTLRDIKMGCTASPVSCQPPLIPAPPSQDGRQQDCTPKIAEVPSSLDRLSQATGGMEKSWYHCIFPFGLISLVIGTAATGVAFTYHAILQVRVLSVTLLGIGLVLMLMATLCWMLHRRKCRTEKDRGSLGPEQCVL
ncbi:transmembrane protein 100-like [Arapaima gigas]